MGGGEALEAMSVNDPSESRVPVHPGDILAGKYRVERVLGVGGMGVVVAAHHLQLDQRVALKFLLPAALRNPEAIERFGREARAAVRIKSEHVAHVTDVGHLENGAPYMVMEYLDGGDMAAWLRERGALALEQAVQFILQACEAIADAHALGIVHRDIKPANLFCIRRSDGVLSIKVLDFGISKLTGLGASHSNMDMTKTSAVMGSPLYMSPEQMQTPKEVDGRTDIWSLGVVLFELLTGRVPFRGDSFPELVLTIVTKGAPSLSSFRPDLPVELDRVMARVLERDRNLRYQNVAELAVALAPFGPKSARPSVERISRVIQGAGLSTGEMTLPSAHDDGGAPTAGTVGAWGQTAPSQGSTGRAAIVGAGVGVLAVGLLVAMGIRLWTNPATEANVSAATAGAVSSSAVHSPQPTAVSPVAADAASTAPPRPLTTAIVGTERSPVAATSSSAVSAPATRAPSVRPAPATLPPAERDSTPKTRKAPLDMSLQ